MSRGPGHPGNWHGDRLRRPPADRQGAGTDQSRSAQGRPSIQVWFECAGRYQRVFRSVDGSGYMARCSMCGKTMNFRVGPDGTGQRVFKLSC